MDFNEFLETVESAANNYLQMTAKRRKLIIEALSRRDPKAKPVLTTSTVASARTTRYNTEGADLRIIYAGECEPDTELRDTERVPLLDGGGTEAFFQREVLPYAPDAWIDDSKTAVGYEISFAWHFYEPKSLRPLKEIEEDIRILEHKTEGILDRILMKGT